MNSQQQNSYLTHRANAGAGRHGWLRLTPAYSVRLVRERTRHLPTGAVVTDPFSGSGTTALAAAEHGCDGHAVDVNPFLVWLGNAKAARYPAALLTETRASVPVITGHAVTCAAAATALWAPNLHNIGRWWSAGSLAALKGLRRALDDACLPAAAQDLLGIAFCRTAIAASNAAFNHQSMSFSAPPAPADADGDCAEVIRRFGTEAGAILSSAEAGLPGAGRIATSRLNGWAPDGTVAPIEDELHEVCALITRDGGKNGPLLATYVAKYFHDMSAHFGAAFRYVKTGGQAIYIIGNSTFYGHVVPAERWYASLLRAAGFTDVRISVLRKRNSNLALYEYEVTASRP